MKARGHAYRTAPRSGLEPTSVTAVAFARKHHRAALFAFFVGELDGAALFALVGELDGAALFALVGELDGAPSLPFSVRVIQPPPPSFALLSRAVSDVEGSLA